MTDLNSNDVVARLAELLSAAEKLGEDVAAYTKAQEDEANAKRSAEVEKNRKDWIAQADDLHVHNLKVRYLHRFQDRPRKEVPPYALQYPKHNFADPENSDCVICPGCERSIFMDHGDMKQCGCGVYMETYGNGLKMWRE